MRFSTRARYALRMMLDIGRHGNRKTPISLSLVAERTGISRGYLEQLAMALRNAHLVRSVSGRYGGYTLMMPASDITVGQIIEAAIGPICVVDCVGEPDICSRSEFCECRVVYALINKKVADVLEDFSLEDLLDPSWVNCGLELGVERGIAIDAAGCSRGGGVKSGLRE